MVKFMLRKEVVLGGMDDLWNCLVVDIGEGILGIKIVMGGVKVGIVVKNEGGGRGWVMMGKGRGGREKIGKGGLDIDEENVGEVGFDGVVKNGEEKLRKLMGGEGGLVELGVNMRRGM